MDVDTIFTRFAFFEAPFDKVSHIERMTDEDYLGCVVMRTLRLRGQERHTLYEGVLRKPRLLNHYIHSSRVFQTTVAGKQFHVAGSYFCQQDSLLGVCAHAALKMMLRNLGTDLRDEDINAFLGIDHESHWVGQKNGEVRGPTIEEMSAVLEKQK